MSAVGAAASSMNQAGLRTRMLGLRPVGLASRPRPRALLASPSSRASSRPESQWRPTLGLRSWPTAMNSQAWFASAAGGLLPLPRLRPRRVEVRPVPLVRQFPPASEP
eukprot:13204051-Alexandrium_andersonii.AAC.1